MYIVNLVKLLSCIGGGPGARGLFAGVFAFIAFASFGCETETPSLQDQEAVVSDFLILTEQDITELTSSIDLFEENVAQKLSENPGFESYEDYFAGVEESLASAESNDTKPFENPMDLQNRFNVDVQNSDDGFEILPTVNSFVLRSIVNKHGVIQIGEILYQYDGEVVAKVPSAKVTDFTDLFSNPDAKFETYIGSSSAETELKRNLEGICNINYRTNRRDHRLKPRWYSDFVKIGGEKVGETWIEAKHQKKRWGVWFANSEDRIRMSGTWNLFTGAGLPAEFTDVNETCTNCSKLEEIIGLMPTTDAEKDRTDWIISGNTTNTTEDGGVTRTCIINN